MTEDNRRKFGKWHFAILVVSLYALVVLVSLFSHQPQATMDLILHDGAGGVGVLLALVLIFL